jgi:tRNA1(Val) A37 N6-methylase TrmN6
MHEPHLDTNDESPIQFTEDFLLGGRVFLRQPATGYRVAIDPIFLAASLEIAPGDSVLDVGAGVGAASLCLATRCPDAKVTAVEMQRDQVRFAVDNVNLNQLRSRIEVMLGDLLRPPPRLAAGTFSHVMANPPFMEPHQGRKSPNPQKQHSNHEGEATLDHWAKFCLLMVKPKGTVTFVHRADRLDQVLSYFAGKLGDIVVYPLWPGNGNPAKRVLVRGVKNAHGAMKLMPGLVLHGSDGRFTVEADAILRQGEGLIMG